MTREQHESRRCILGVFPHPDDETSSSAGTFARYTRRGVDVYVATATRGEQGTLGTDGQTIARENLPSVREAELRSVLELLGAHPPIFLGYRDQQLKDVDFEEMVGKITDVMRLVHPGVVITFGPLGISRHEDHVTIHRATLDAFQRYRTSADPEPRLFYVAIPRDAAKRFEMDLDGPEVEPTVTIDIKEYRNIKIQSWRIYRSQADAQEIATMYEESPWDSESFHQALPEVPDGVVASGFWEE